MLGILLRLDGLIECSGGNPEAIRQELEALYTDYIYITGGKDQMPDEAILIAFKAFMESQATDKNLIHFKLCVLRTIIRKAHDEIITKERQKIYYEDHKKRSKARGKGNLI